MIEDTAMNALPRLEELLRLWEQRQDQGRPVTAEELCRGCPELLAPLQSRIAELLADRQHQQTIAASPHATPQPISTELPTSSAHLPPTGAFPETATEASAAPAAEQMVGRAGRYLILDRIAEGGMGTVYRAHDPDFQRTLAVKVMHPPSPKFPEAERRFLEEARITGRLQHPGIPPAHELGRLDDGRLFFAMKLIEGQTLAVLLNERDEEMGRWGDEEINREEQASVNARRARNDKSGLLTSSSPRFLGIFEQICQTLAYAHSRGVIHRDLKPSNIMVGAFGEVQLMDWGLAKELKDEGRRMKDESEQTDRLSDSSFILHPLLRPAM
jgi:tRNA A-37 threonylcarbamoyl transferase component Bud32